MINKLKLPFTFDPALLKEDLNKVEASDWIKHFNKSDYEGEWEGAALRGKKDAVHPILRLAANPGVTEFSDYELLNECSYFKYVADTFECPKMYIRLLSLKPGSVIKEHCDPDLGYEEGDIRIHVPVKTNENVIFTLNGERVIMNEGETWYLNFSLPHSITNAGNEDRVHLILDCKVNDWVRELFNTC